MLPFSQSLSPQTPFQYGCQNYVLSCVRVMWFEEGGWIEPEKQIQKLHAQV